MMRAVVFTKKTSALLIVLLIMFAVLNCVNSKQTNTAAAAAQHLYDDAQLLTTAERAECERYLSSASEKTGADILVATVPYYLFYPEEAGDTFLYKHGYSTYDNIILLIVHTDGSQYYYDLYTYGDAFEFITASETDYILDDESVYDNIKSGHLKSGIVGFSQVSAKYYMDDDSLPLYVFVLIGLGIGLLAGGITIGVIIAKYKMKIVPTNYPLEHYTKLDLKFSNDVFITKTVTRVAISTSSSGRGGRGGHRGGHRGGR